MTEKENANPVIHAQRSQIRAENEQLNEWWRDSTLESTTKSLADQEGEKDSGYGSSDDVEEIDSQEVYDLLRSISDPEHPLTLEQLAVVNAEHITVDPGNEEEHRAPHILVLFTPTIPHCSMATLIGLALRVRLLRAVPARFKVDIRVRPGTHQSENAVNKQLNDKERVAAALENGHLLNVVSECLSTAGRRGLSEEETMRKADDLAIELGLSVA